MDKIWDRNPSKSEVIGRCGGDEKTKDHAEPTKSNAKNKRQKKEDVQGAYYNKLRSRSRSQLDIEV